MIGTATIFAAALVGQVQTTGPCLQNTDRLRGELRWVQTKHPNGTDLKYPFLVLAEPRCVVSDGAMTSGRWIQISPAEPGTFSPLVPGSTIIIEADEYFVPHTAWHIGDIVALRVRLVGYELQ